MPAFRVPESHSMGYPDGWENYVIPENVAYEFLSSFPGNIDVYRTGMKFKDFFGVLESRNICYKVC